MTETTITSTATVSTAPDLGSEIEEGANIAADVLAGFDPAIGLPAEAAVKAGETIGNTVASDVGAHHTALQTATDAASELVAVSGPVVASLPPADAVAVQAKLTGLMAILSEIKGFFAAL